MIDPDLVVSTLVSSFQSIPAVVTALGSTSLVVGHEYLYGVDNSLIRAINEMPGPSVLIVYLDLIGGQFSGMQVWKHRLEVYIRPKNAATGPAPGSSPPHLWWLMMNSVVPFLGGTQNIRYARLLPNLFPVDAMPHLTHRQDENGADLFCGSIVIGEQGDA
jgi:hypothetical protein